MIAGIYNTKVERGSVFRRTITYEDAEGTPVDLSDYSIQMVIWRGDISFVTLTNDDGITIDGNEFTVFISAITMRTFDPGNWRYTIQVTPPSGEEESFKLLEGFITVER